MHPAAIDHHRHSKSLLLLGILIAVSATLNAVTSIAITSGKYDFELSAAGAALGAIVAASLLLDVRRLLAISTLARQGMILLGVSMVLWGVLNYRHSEANHAAARHAVQSRNPPASR